MGRCKVFYTLPVAQGSLADAEISWWTQAIILAYFWVQTASELEETQKHIGCWAYAWFLVSRLKILYLLFQVSRNVMSLHCRDEWEVFRLSLQRCCVRCPVLESHIYYLPPYISKLGLHIQGQTNSHAVSIHYHLVQLLSQVILYIHMHTHRHTEIKTMYRIPVKLF